MKDKRYKKLPLIPYPKNDRALRKHLIEKHILPRDQKFVKTWSVKAWLGTSSWENDHKQAHSCRESGVWRKVNHRHG